MGLRQQSGDNKDKMDLEQIRLLLENQPRNLLFFEMIIKTTAKVQNLLRLKVADLKYLKIGDPLPVSNRNGADTIFTSNMRHILNKLIRYNKLHDSDFLFKSHKGNKPLSPTSVSRLVRKWLHEAGLKRYSGIRDLRLIMRSYEEGNTTLFENNQKPSMAYSLPKIKTRTHQEAVFLELERAIISGKIPPGQKLVTGEIAERMGVSRIPVREAMRRLEARGFIITRANWGSVVNELSHENLKEILYLRLMLECEAIAKAAPRIKADTIHELERVHKEFAEARSRNDADRMLMANREFHILAYQDAQTPLLLDLINQLWDRVSPYYHIMFRQSITSHPTRGVDFHDHIVRAMRDRDPEKAKYWLKADLTNSAEFVHELFELHKVVENK